MQTNLSNAPPAATPLAVLSALAVALAIGLTTWFFTASRQAMTVEAREQAQTFLAPGPDSPSHLDSLSGPSRAAVVDQAVNRMLKVMDAWTTKLTFATAATGVGMMITLLAGAAWWRRSVAAQVQRRQTEWEEQTLKLRDGNLEVKRQVAARERAERALEELRVNIELQVQERTTELAKAHTALERELNERRQAEKNLAQQRQELERSKDILELHVQARTQELQKLQRRYEHILNSAGEGIYGLDLQDKTTFVNPAAAKLTGCKVEELVGKAESEAFCGVADRKDASAATQFLTREGAARNERVFCRKDGTTFPAEYVRSPILENNKPVGAVVVFKDITERKRAEETLARKAAELARSNAELEQFAYVASHDLQEPLRKIQSFGDRLKTKVEAAKLEDGRDYLDRMQNAAARMQRLIADLLTFSRVISSSQPFVPVDLNVITKEVLSDLEVSIERTKAQIEVGPLPTVDADPLQMRQLLQNLISNSLKFQVPDATPTVKIQARMVKRPFSCAKNPTPDDEMVELKLQDNGIGFDERYLDKIFAVFQRLHGRSEYEGTGVGLAVCRRITDRHGGTITAKSKPGEGATFTVTLPARQAGGGKKQ